MYTRIRLVMLIYPFLFSFSNIQTLKIFVTLFSGTVQPRRFKLVAHMDNGLMHCVYGNQAAAAYLSLYFFIFSSLQFSNIKIIFVTLFSGTVRPKKVEKLYPRGQCMDELYIPKVFITFFSRTGRHKKLKQYKVTNMKNK